MSEDALDELQRLLAEVDDVAVPDRVERFERANELLAGELAVLDDLGAQ